jgi:hypothetical protein
MGEMIPTITFDAEFIGGGPLDGDVRAVRHGEYGWPTHYRAVYRTITGTYQLVRITHDHLVYAWLGWVE